MTWEIKRPETITITKGGLQHTAIVCQVDKTLNTCAMRLVFDPYGGIGGFAEVLNPEFFEYSLLRQLDPTKKVPDWLTISGLAIVLKAPLTADMVVTNLKILIRADYFGVAGGNVSLRHD